VKCPYIFQHLVLKSEDLHFCHVFTSVQGLFLVAVTIGLVTCVKFGWDIMIMNTRYIIGSVKLLLAVVQLLLGVV